MRGMKRSLMEERRIIRTIKLGKHEMMARRTANYNAHVITPHGKIQAGRKGR